MANGDDNKPISPEETNESTESTKRNTEETKKNNEQQQSLLKTLLAEANARKALNDLEEEAYLRSQSTFKLQEKIKVQAKNGIERELTRIEVLKRVTELEEKQIKNKGAEDIACSSRREVVVRRLLIAPHCLPVRPQGPCREAPSACSHDYTVVMTTGGVLGPCLLEQWLHVMTITWLHAVGHGYV